MSNTEKASRQMPVYTQLSDAMLDPKWWRKRVMLIAIGAGAVSAGLTRLGGVFLWPGDNLAVVSSRVSAIESKVRAHDLMLDSLTRQVGTNIYLTCELLSRVNPQGAVAPQSCPRSP